MFVIDPKLKEASKGEGKGFSVNPAFPINQTITGGGSSPTFGTTASKSETPILDELFGGSGSGSGSSGDTKVPSVEESSGNGYIAWADTEAGRAASDKLAGANSALNAYGTKFKYSGQSDLDEIMRQIQENPEFTYDLDGDALYQQYKDQYIRNGQLAMEDTIGQAAALTGGYGNSYAQTAGQQAYNAQLDQLNDRIPELYQLAYDKYQDERDALYDQYSVLAAERDNEYGKWADGYQRLVDAEEKAKSEYDYGRSEYIDDMMTEISLQPEEEEFKSYINNMSANEFKGLLTNNYADDPDGLNDFLAMCVNQGIISPEQSLFYYTMIVEGKDDSTSGE